MPPPLLRQTHPERWESCRCHHLLLDRGPPLHPLLLPPPLLLLRLPQLPSLLRLLLRCRLQNRLPSAELGMLMEGAAVRLHPCIARGGLCCCCARPLQALAAAAAGGGCCCWARNPTTLRPAMRCSFRIAKGRPNLQALLVLLGGLRARLAGPRRCLQHCSLRHVQVEPLVGAAWLARHRSGVR